MCVCKSLSFTLKAHLKDFFFKKSKIRYLFLESLSLSETEKKNMRVIIDILSNHFQKERKKRSSERDRTSFYCPCFL